MKTLLLTQKKILNPWLKAVAVIVLLLLIALPVLSQSGGDYELLGSSTGSSRSLSAGGDYVLSGVVGQAEVGQLSGGTYTLDGGFGRDDHPPSFSHPLYLPMTLR